MGIIDRAVDYLAEEWRVFLKAPILSITLIVLSLCGGWYLADLRGNEVLDVQTAHNAFLRTQLDEAQKGRSEELQEIWARLEQLETTESSEDDKSDFRKYLESIVPEGWVVQ